MDRPAAWRANAVDLERERPFRVGGATVDPISRDAHYANGRERLQPQTLKVLVALTRKRGGVVTRSDLIDACWDGRIVGEDVINRSISLLRDFAERAGGFSIETIPKAGYRLIDDRQRRVSPKSALRWAMLVVLLLAIAAGSWFALRSLDDRRKPPLIALRSFTSSADAGSRDLAAATGDALAHMMVAGSFHGKLAWPATASDEAKADLILMGDVRRTGEAYAATVQLRDRRSGTLLFSERFDAPIKDPSLLPEQVGAQMSSNLTGALALMVLDRRQSGSPELTADKLKTITNTVNNDDPLVSYQISRRVAQTNPNSVLAQLGVAYDTAFALDSMPKEERPDAVRRARLAADNALRMAPRFGDTYVPWCLLRPPTHSRECEDRMRAGMRADPDAPFVPVFLSSLLYSMGRFEESAQFARAALAADPFHPQKLRRVVRTLILEGQKEEAEKLFAKAVRWWPTHDALYWDRLNAYAMTGDLDSAGQALAQMPPSMLEAQRVQIASMLSAYRSKDGDRVRNLCLSPDADFLVQSYCLTTLPLLNQRDAAMKIADRLFFRTIGATERETEAMWLAAPVSWPQPIMSAPATAWLRADPRFLNIARRTGATLYWRSDRLPDFCRKEAEPVCTNLIAGS